MKVIWLCNVILPSVAEALNCSTSNSGGWLVGLSNDLKDKVELITVFPLKAKEENRICGNAGKIRYYGLPVKKISGVEYSSELEKRFEEVLKIENPDIVHIFGTEFPHTLAMVNACERLGMAKRVVISIQGLIAIWGKHYYSDLPQKVVNSYTLRDWLRRDNIREQARKFLRRGAYETEALKKVQHIIGRTDFDRAVVTEINPNINYYFCNETLRSEFYQHTWEFEKCERYSIFISQCSYPIKGFHYLLEAFVHVLREYPLAHLYTTGTNPVEVYGRDKIRMSSYQKYLGRMIAEKKLQNKITFLGELNEKQMCERFLKSNVFVSASSMENSPNSVGEAMLLGVPTVASDVGGTSNMLVHREEGFLYQHNEPYLLAYYIKKIFADVELAGKFSRKGREHAAITHEGSRNRDIILDIYRMVQSLP